MTSTRVGTSEARTIRPLLDSTLKPGLTECAWDRAHGSIYTDHWEEGIYRVDEDALHFSPEAWGGGGVSGRAWDASAHGDEIHRKDPLVGADRLEVFAKR